MCVRVCVYVCVNACVYVCLVHVCMCVVSVHDTTWNIMTQRSTQLVHTSVITRYHSAVFVADLSYGSHMGRCL